MIVELFGPPGVGKTTFALALAKELRSRGHTVEVILSYRPAERIALVRKEDSKKLTAVFRRLLRPLGELASLARHPRACSHDFETAVALVKILPPKSFVWSIRLVQYLSRLSHTWFLASAAAHIVLFDQAYVQAICSLAVVGHEADEAVLARALDAMPKSDLSIRMVAPLDVLVTRLCERHRLQGTIERLFEFDLKRNLESVQVVERLYELMRRTRRPVTCVSSLDQKSVCDSVDDIEQKLSSNDPVQSTGVA